MLLLPVIHSSLSLTSFPCLENIAGAQTLQMTASSQPCSRSGFSQSSMYKYVLKKAKRCTRSSEFLPRS